MRNNAAKIVVKLAVALLVVVTSTTVGRSQGSSKQPPADSTPTSGPTATRTPVRMSVEEKLVRDVYARLMRYQSAGLDESTDRDGKTIGPQDYLTFELRNIQSGPIADLQRKSMSEIATARSGEVLSIRPVHLSERKGPEHAFYEAEWATVPEDGDQIAPQETLFGEANRYTTYVVIVRLNGKQRVYRATAVYRLDQDDAAGKGGSPGKLGQVEILDNIAGGMDAVYSDASPRVRIPWTQYVRSSLYAGVVREITEARQAGTPLIPDDAPIGYLPGDNLMPGDGGGGDGGGDPPDPPPACAAPRISGPGNVWWFNGQTPTGYATSITLTASPASGSSYTWTVTAGSDKVTLSNQSANTIRVTGANASTFHEVRIRVNVDGLNSPSFSLSVRAPNRLVLTQSFVQAADATWGYDTQVHYRIEDQFTDVLPSSVPLNEHFTTGIVADFTGMDWRRGAEGGATVSPSDWYDQIQGETAGHTPAPRNPCSPLCSTKVYHWDGGWYIGSTTIGVGRRVQTNTWQKFTDHAEHTNRTSPAP